MVAFLASIGKKAVTAVWLLFVYSTNFEINSNILQQVFLLQNGSLVGIILGGSNIQTQINISFVIQAVLSVAQCIFYDSTFRHCKQATGIYHNTMREPPLPIYVGLLLHGETRKRSLVDKFYDLGLAVSYDRVLSISADEMIYQNFTNQKV